MHISRLSLYREDYLLHVQMESYFLKVPNIQCLNILDRQYLFTSSELNERYVERNQEGTSQNYMLSS